LRNPPEDEPKEELTETTIYQRLKAHLGLG
jgi:hypothetical protein